MTCANLAWGHPSWLHARLSVTSRALDGAEQRDVPGERELANAARQGDRRALGVLLRHHGPSLYREVLLPRLGNPMVAEQALADTYARVVEKIGLFEWHDAGFYPWLRTVALHIAIDILRARKREVLFAADEIEREIDRDALDATDDPIAGFHAHDERAAVRAKLERALGAIHPRYAQAIRLRVLADVPRDQAARELGVSPSTFDVVFFRAIKAMRKAVALDAAAAPSRGEP